MKRNFFIIMMMAAAVITSCTKQILNEEQPIVDLESATDTETGTAETYTYTVSAKTIDTKSDYDSDGKFSWTAGDAISVLFHNGDTDKFFTLTLTEGAGTKTATFSGEIEAGYTIGASDAAEGDSKIWALFPASENHTYTAGSAPDFYVQPFVDFSETHFSANIPMYALNTEEGAFSFANLASTYKFTVNGIKDGVSKVKFQIYNQETYALSGCWPIHADERYIKYDYATPGSEKSTLTYISDVTDNQAVFYVSCRYYGKFQPVITVTNCATNMAIKTFTASTYKEPNYLDHVWPITLDVSDGNYFTPAVTIDGDFADWDDVAEWESTRTSGSTNSRINNWKMQADAYNIYVYLNLVTSKIKNSSYFYVGFDTDSDLSTGDPLGGLSGLEKYVLVYPAVDGSDPIAMIQGSDPRSAVNGSWDGTLMTWCSKGESNTFVEVCIPRSKVGLTDPASMKVSVAFDWYDTIQQELILP